MNLEIAFSSETKSPDSVMPGRSSQAARVESVSGVSGASSVVTWSTARRPRSRSIRDHDQGDTEGDQPPRDAEQRLDTDHDGQEAQPFGELQGSLPGLAAGLQQPIPL